MVHKVSTIWLLLLEVSLHTVSRCQAELYAAISVMEPLLETHKRITDALDLYIKTEKQKMQTLKRHLDFYKQEHKARKDEPNSLESQIFILTLINRLTADIDVIADSVKMGSDDKKNISMKDDDIKYPTMEDLTGAAQALARLQETYHLNVTDLAEGILNGDVTSTPMTTGDCYELGRALYNEKDVKNALAWMMEAYRKFQKAKNKETLRFREVDILEYIAFSFYLLGDTKLGLKWAYELLKLDPLLFRTIGNIPHFAKIMKEKEANERRQLGELSVKSHEKRTESGDQLKYSFENEIKNYESLCRGELDIAPDIFKRLKCWYSSENQPFLKYAPFKVEQKYIAPDIFIYHDVLYDSEIKVMKSIAKPNFKRAVVEDPKTGELHPTSYRISMTSWLKNEEHPVIARISQRVADMAGLDLETAEDLQVANYGIGGHYEPHFDFSRRCETPVSVESGNRIATVLFYMSEVAQGGATVFTELGLGLFPIKGAAVFWTNLHPSGEGDLATRHGACPVLRGSKWVCTKWIHQSGQELIKPCTLDYQDEGILRNLLQPVPKTLW